MVVSPDFLPVAAIATGFTFGRRRLALGGLRPLLVGFAGAVALVAVLALVAHAVGALPTEEVTRNRPLTDFIWQPTLWSLVVALPAGAAGSFALSAPSATTLVGVFIAITTVPAAGILAIALALGSGTQAAGSLVQLGTDIAGMLIAAVVVLTVQRHLSHPPRDLLRPRRWAR